MNTEPKALGTATVSTLRAHGVVLTTHFYRRLFEYNPELKNVFNLGNQQNGKQQTALARYSIASPVPKLLRPARQPGPGRKRLNLGFWAGGFRLLWVRRV